MESTTVTSKGQVTIPKEIRQRLGIRKNRGDHVQIVKAEGSQREPDGLQDGSTVPHRRLPRAASFRATPPIDNRTAFPDSAPATAD